MRITQLYRLYSEDALKAAREATNTDVKLQWLAVAEEWTQLAAARLAMLVEKENSKSL